MESYVGVVQGVESLSLKGDPEGSITSLLERSHLMMSELEQFEEYSNQQQLEVKRKARYNQGFSVFKNGVKTEIKKLEKLTEGDLSSPQTTHVVRSSNLPWYFSRWAVAKQCTELLAFHRRFYWTLPKAKEQSQRIRNGKQPLERSTTSTLVDIVAQDGLEWINVSTITERRILFDLAKEGYGAFSSGEESSDEREENEDSNNDSGGLLSKARSLVKASKATTIRYQHPSIRLVLPRIIKHNCSREVSKLLEKIEALGVTVETCEDTKPAPVIDEVLSRLVVDRFRLLTETINIDCTILLALVSDLSHVHVQKEDWQAPYVARQIEMESENQFLPNTIWPACSSRKMVCTSEAATRLQEIVDLIGTEPEKERTYWLLGEATDNTVTKAQRIEGFQRLSNYKVPDEWQLPIEIVSVDVPELMKKLPLISVEVRNALTPMNQSIFVYGWATGYSTVSGNRVVAREIERIIEDSESEDDRGPNLWICTTSRSLLAKERTSRGAVNQSSGPGPD